MMPPPAAAAAADVTWALRAAEKAIDADPDFSFTFSGSYPRLARHWAVAMSGGDPVTAAVEVERVIEAYGERYAEGLVLLIRAQALRAGGDLGSAARVARRARVLSQERGAHLFATRADGLLAALPGGADA
ncbi:hypothetical protein ACQPWW_21615 [Micromonospora sp. CA-240977]|uniref:hypothetical protein n=1 Tax=Micromonospora sp. CA-240977 TaxID=3239957 RepID=UPI003D903B2D